MFFFQPSREPTYPGSPFQGSFEDDCPFPQLGYVSSPEGRCPILWTCFDCIELIELDLLKAIVYVLPWVSNAKLLFREYCSLTYCNYILSK